MFIVAMCGCSARGRGVRATVLDTTSAASVASAAAVASVAVFQKRRCCCYTDYLRARDTVLILYIFVYALYADLVRVAMLPC